MGRFWWISWVGSCYCLGGCKHGLGHKGGSNYTMDLSTVQLGIDGSVLDFGRLVDQPFHPKSSYQQRVLVGG